MIGSVCCSSSWVRWAYQPQCMPATPSAKEAPPGLHTLVPQLRPFRQWDAGLPTVSAGTSFTPLPRAESWPPPTSSQPLPPPLYPPLLGLAYDSSASSSCLLQQNGTLLCNQFAPRTLAVREPLEPMSTLTLIPQS